MAVSSPTPRPGSKAWFEPAAMEMKRSSAKRKRPATSKGRKGKGKAMTGKEQRTDLQVLTMEAQVATINQPWTGAPEASAAPVAAHPGTRHDELSTAFDQMTEQRLSAHPGTRHDELSTAFDQMTEQRLSRQRTAQKDRWAEMTGEDQMAEVQKIQKEEVLALFSVEYDEAMGLLSDDQRRKRTLQPLKDMWRGIALLDGKMRVGE